MKLCTSNLDVSKFIFQRCNFFFTLFKNHLPVAMFLSFEWMEWNEFIRCHRKRCTFWPQISFLTLFSQFWGVLCECEHLWQVQPLGLGHPSAGGDIGQRCWIEKGTAVLVEWAGARPDLCSIASSPISPAEICLLNFFWSQVAMLLQCVVKMCVLVVSQVCRWPLFGFSENYAKGRILAFKSLHSKTSVNLCDCIGWA